jgi:two-component system sensor histidine kinase YesM
MRRINQNGFTTQIDQAGGNEEIELINSTFNEMLRRLSQMKINLYEEKLLNQKTMQDYYQLQIKPHFFLNCLNMILQFLYAGNYALVERLTVNLGRYYQYQLKNNAPFVKLREELEFIGNYLEIQKIRYPHNLEIVFDIESCIREAEIPPLLLHTFVENAVKHAMNMDGFTVIKISGHSLPLQRMQLSVEDTGPGFPDGILYSGQIDRSSDDGRRHIGLSNTRQRLMLLYGDSGKLSLNNRESGGAEVVLILPVIFPLHAMPNQTDR